MCGCFFNNYCFVFEDGAFRCGSSHFNIGVLAIQYGKSSNEKRINVFHEKLPQTVPWHTAGVQYVVEASGMFTTYEKASGHLASDSVKRVIVTAPSADVPMIIMGVNDNKLKIEQKIMSCASSTLYCLAPIIKVLEDEFGVTDGFMTSIHAMTPSLKPLDGMCLKGKHWRDHRSIHQNIIPASTGACKALGKIIPQMKDKLSGLAFRVPIVNVSVLDLTVRLNNNTTLTEIVKSVEKASKTNMQNVIRISSEQSVSSDFIGESHSCIFDEDSSIQLTPNFFKIICWYENEYSYACRVAHSILFAEKLFSHLELPSQIAYRPRPFRKQDMMQQTECYKREISVSCDYPSVNGITSPQESEKSKHRPLKKKPLLTTSSTCKRRYEVFKIWNDTKEIAKPIVKNRNAFFESCIVKATPVPKPIEKAQTRLDNVKREFTKMVNITEDLLKKTHSNQSDVYSLSKAEFGNKSDVQFRAKDTFFIADTERYSYKLQKNDPVETCGDCKSLSFKNMNQVLSDSRNKEEVSVYSYDKDISDTTLSVKTIDKQDIVKDIQTVNILKDPIREIKEHNILTEKSFDETAFATKISRPQNDDFKTQLTKTLSTLIEGLSINIKVQSLINDPKILDKEKHKIDANNVIYKNIEQNDSSVSQKCDAIENETIVTKTKPLDLDSNINLDEKMNLHEKYKTIKYKNDDMNVKLIDEKLRKRNIVLLDNSFESEAICDGDISNSLTAENTKPYRNPILEQIPEGLTTNREVIVKVLDTRCYSPENINTTVSNRDENIQDIYDKLDSASETDSANSFDINERKSQVIHITDLTNSFENLERLDKICRIIEISDELSDKLFSDLDNKNDDLKNKRWSFRDLCERIHLDEFCNKVFGKSTV